MEMRDGPSVRVLSVSRVAPSSPAAKAGRVKLSCLDVRWLWLPAVQNLFLYDRDDAAESFPAVVSRLKAALADTLTHYLPFAGRLVYEAGTGDVAVDCSDASVAFVVADAAGGMDVRRLAYDEAHDMPAFLSLVPELDGRLLPAPVLSVQITRLGACGLAVGLATHHAVADGRALWRFMEAWAWASSAGELRRGKPTYCRDAVHHPRGDELAREWLKIMEPNLPVVSSSMGERDLTSPLLRLARRTFHVGASDLRSLKQRIDHLSATAMTTAKPAAIKPKPVSTFVALAALSWTAFVRSKGLGAGDDTYLVFLADVRARLHPPVSAAYLGNCLRDCLAVCPDAADIARGEAGILHAVRAVQAAVAEMEAAPLLGYDEALSDRVRKLPSERRTSVVGSQWFPAYQGTDFGFGRPALLEVVSMAHDGEMMLHGGRRDGEVQLSVAIHPAHMPTYRACMLAYLPTLSPNVSAL